MIDQELESNMSKIRVIVEKIHAQRSSLGFKIRQPLASVSISGKSFGDKNLQQIILEETNIKELSFTNQGDTLEVKLDTHLTSALKQEGEAREIIRTVQKARKKLGTNVDDKIILTLPDWPSAYTDYIKEKTLATQLTKGEFHVEPSI